MTHRPLRIAALGLALALAPGARADIWDRCDVEAIWQDYLEHAKESARALEGELDGLARRFAYERVGEDRIRWRIPPDCARNPWGCVYRDVLADSREPLTPLADRLSLLFESEGWTRVDAAGWLLSFAQEIPYALPDTRPCGLLPPAIVASRDWGDCDSKSLLLMALLDRMGIGSLLLVSEAHAHALLAIDVRAGHDPLIVKGREYAWAETTARFPLGMRPPGLESPDDWEIVLHTPSRR